MARKFGTPINLQQLELQNARIQNLTGDPSGVEGQVYWNSSTDKLRIHNGTTWVDVMVGTVASGDITDGTIVNADINAAAAIAYSKLALTGLIVNADIAAGAGIVYSKLNLALGIVNADISASAAIALSKLAVDPLARGNHTGTQLAATISNFDTQVRTNPINLHAVPTADVPLNAKKITGLADGTAATDAVTKQQLDGVVSGLDVKASCRAATTAAITIPPGGTTFAVDGVTLANGDRLLVKDQTPGAANLANGIYVVGGVGTSVTLTRSTDADTSAEVTAGLFTFVSEGTVNADSGWYLQTNNPIVLGTTALQFVQFSGAGQVVSGAGLTKSGNTLDVVGTANRITVAADSVDISTAYAGQATIVTVGTIATGSWNATTIPLAKGGTGATTATAARTALGAVGGYSNGAVHGAGTTIVITAATHGQGANRNSIVQIIEEATGDVVEADINIAASGDVTITFAASQAANSHRVLVAGF